MKIVLDGAPAELAAFVRNMKGESFEALIKRDEMGPSFEEGMHKFSGILKKDEADN